MSGDVARGEAVPRLPHAPAGLKIPLRPLLAQARRPLLPPVAQHCPPRGRQLLPSPCFQKPPRPRRYLGCSIPRRSRADCCRRAGSPATVLEPPPQPQLPVSSCRQPSWRASATERPPRRPRQAFGYVLGRPCPRPESTRKSTRKSTRSHYSTVRSEPPASGVGVSNQRPFLARGRVDLGLLGGGCHGGRESGALILLGLILGHVVAV